MNEQNFLNELQKTKKTGLITQTDLSKVTGLTQGAISKIINGKNTNINFSTVLILWPFVYGAPFPDKAAHN